MLRRTFVSADRAFLRVVHVDRALNEHFIDDSPRHEGDGPIAAIRLVCIKTDTLEKKGKRARGK